MSSGAQAFVQGAFGALQSGAPSIAMQPVKSSNMAAIGYDAPTKTLELHFTSGSKYRYADVPQSIFDTLLQSDSIGSFFATEIRGKYASTKVEDKPQPTPTPAPARPQSSWPFPTRG